MTLLAAPPPAGTVFDVCVVGAGPVGLSLALEAAARGLHVLLLEAGTQAGAGIAATGRSTAEVLDTAHHAPLDRVTVSAFGGTSWLWGGRCVPFEDVDFEVRDHVPHSGWPISAADLSAYYARAAHYLDCGSPGFRSDDPDWPGMPDVSMAQQERWARHPRFNRSLGARALAHPLVAVLCEARVIDIAFDDDLGGVGGVRLRHPAGSVDVKAEDFVLACGGLETTRLLLAVQRRRPTLFGGASGDLGRYYMGHLTGSIANIELENPAMFRDLDFRRDEGGTFVRRRFTISSSAQRAHRLLNTSFYLGNPSVWDHRHGSATLSLFWLVLNLPGLGRITGRSLTLDRHRGPRSGAWRRHVRNVLRRPGRAVVEIVQMAYLRFLAAVRRSVYVVRSADGVYALRYHAEQVPNADSRVWLSESTGEDDLPKLVIDFRYLGQDVDSVLAAHVLLDEQLRAAGHGRLAYLHPDTEQAAAVLAQAGDGYHQIGTTRMSATPERGVVDADCRVHGLANLYVTSSSVFPTAGEANPTFMAVCLAVRLADRLSRSAADRLSRSAVDGAP